MDLRWKISFFLTLLEVFEIKGRIMSVTVVKPQKAFVENKACSFLTKQLKYTEKWQITIQSHSYGVRMMVLYRS